MSDTNTNSPSTPVTTQPTAPTAGQETITTEYQGNTITLRRMSTQGKGKSSGVAYWGLSVDDLTVTKELKNDKGEVTGRVQDDDATLAALTKVLGAARVLDYTLSKANVNLKATQLHEGKDEYDMSRKAEMVREYITNDFGAVVKAGGIAAALKTVKAENDSMRNTLMAMQQWSAKLMAINVQLANPATTAADRVRLSADMATLLASTPIQTAPVVPTTQPA